jgi:DNA polymerase-3 subunit beta
MQAMKLSFKREHMLAAFQTAAVVVPTRSPKAILKNVRIDASAGQAVITATDMEVGIRIEVPDVQTDSPGSIVAPVNLFGSILRESSDEMLHIDAGSQGTTVRGDRSEFKMPYQNPDEFPLVSTFNETVYHEIPGRLFRELIRRTTFATDTENSRYALGGVLLELDGQKVIAVATDSRRLAKMEGPVHCVGGTSNQPTAAIVPTRAMQLMERALADTDIEIQIAARVNDILVKSPRTTIYSRLVEGRFPRWKDVIPSRRESVRIDLAVGPVHAALRQAAIFTNSDSKGIDFTFGNGSLVMQASTAEAGQSRVELPIPYDGPPISLSLDNRYVLDFLRVLDPQKSITVDVVDSESAALFSTDDGYNYVVMPMAREN